MFHEENFCDLIIECDYLFKYLHSCIFIARVPILFELLKEYFIVGRDTSLVPVFDYCSTSGTISNPLYDNHFNENSSVNSFEEDRIEIEQQKFSNQFIHIRLPSELLKIFDLVNFLQNIYSEEGKIENQELELISILNKIKLLQDQNLFNLDNYSKLINFKESMSECKINEVSKQVIDDCKRMKVDERIDDDQNEPFYINLEEEKLNNKETFNDSLKKDQTFLLPKINVQNDQFKINILNENNQEIVNKLANINHELKEMENQIDSAEMDKLSIDPENEEQQLITALSNEKIEFNGLAKESDLIYGNIKKDTDTVSDASEICDEFSVNSDLATATTAAKKNVDDNLNIDEIELNFEKQNNEDNLIDEPAILNERNSLFYELINIENKVQKATNVQKEEHNVCEEKKNLLIENNETYSSYENDLEEDKTLSGSMVRSGTFNLQCQTPINNLKTELNKQPIESDDDSSFSKKIEPDSLMSNSDAKITKVLSTKINKSTAKQQQSNSKQQLQSKKSLQYFLDETQIIKQVQETDEMERSLTNSTSRQSSGLFFIDLDDPQLSGMSKSSTFDRKKNRQQQKAIASSDSNESNLNLINDHHQNKKLINQSAHKLDACDLLPMGMIIKKENNEKVIKPIETNFTNLNDGMFRLGNQQFKTLNTISTNNTNRSTVSKSASTLRNSNLKKTKSEITNANLHQQQQKEEEDARLLIEKSLFSCSRLGNDLLKLFINQVNCDFNLLVADKSQQLGGHKCILMARSEFFAKKFSINLDCNQINLTDFSYDSVHFVLCHMYSGTIDVPNFSGNGERGGLSSVQLPSINYEKEYTELNLAELISLSDLFQLSILKDVILFEIKKNYCHHFHRPCNDCITGVINCLNLAHKLELSSLFNCCVNWICRHYKKVWTTKQFASLFIIHPQAENENQSNSPRSTPTKHSHRRVHQLVHKNNDIIESIYQAILDNLTNENVINKILDLQQLASSLTRFKWNEMIIHLIEELIEDCCKYLAINYDQIVSSQTFIQLGYEKSWQLDVLESYLILAVDSMKCEIALRTFIHLENIMIMCEPLNENNSLRTSSLVNHASGDDRFNHHIIYANTSLTKTQFSDEFIRTVQRLYKSIERYLIHNAKEAVYCDSWNELATNVQKHIKTSAILVFEFDRPLSKKPILSSSMMRSSRQSSADKSQTSSANSARRKNIANSKKSISTTTTAIQELSDQSRQSTLTRHSAKSLAKSSDNQKNKNVKENEKSSTEDKLKKDNLENYENDEAHIYDEVPPDLMKEEKKECKVEYAKANKKPSTNIATKVQVVQPFSVLPNDLNMSNITTSSIATNYENFENFENYEELENNYENIIYDETINLQKVGSESSLASSTLQEAENLSVALEQELSRKMQIQRINALKQSKLNNKQSLNNVTTNISSPQLRTSLRCRNRQQQQTQQQQSMPSNSISSISSSINSANQRNVKSSRSSKQKPPFK